METTPQQPEFNFYKQSLLIYSSSDEDIANALWQGLNGSMSIIKQNTVFYSEMLHAMEKSEKLLFLFTKAAVDSGLVSLGLILAIEKSIQRGHMSVYLITEGLQNEDISALTHGLLRYVPHISVDRGRENWETTLLTKLKEPRESMDNLMPAGNLAHGQVFSHYVGYLQHVLPAFQAMLKECDFYEENPGRVCMKFLMLIPDSCNTENPIEDPIEDEYSTYDSEIKIENVYNLRIQIRYGEKIREYTPTVYKATKKGEKQPLYFIGEFPKVLYSVYQLKHEGIADVDTRLEANRFYHTMNMLVNHRLNPGCNDKAVLLRYPDTKVSVGELLWNASNAEIQSGTSSANPDLSDIHDLRREAQEDYEYDATITCLSPGDGGGDVATKIENHLKNNGKRVFQTEITSAQLKAAPARWNIFVMSMHSYEESLVNIHVFSEMERSAADKCIQTLTVISGIKMYHVPDALKAMAVVSTEEQSYPAIILNQMEGKPVHMYQKMPAGDLSKGLGWTYLLNYLPIQLGGKTEEGLDFHGRIRKHLRDNREDCGCLPFFYIVLSSTGEVVKQDVQDGPIKHFGRVEPPIRQHQAGTKDREYYINMYKFTFPDTQKEVCYISEACTPGIHLNTMATEIQFAGIEPGESLRIQIENLGDVIDGKIDDAHYKDKIGDFTKLFRLIRYDKDKDKSLSDVIRRQLETDLTEQTLIHADSLSLCSRLCFCCCCFRQ